MTETSRFTTPAADASRPAATLRRRVFQAGSWSLLGYGASNVLRLVSSLVMTRLLVPEAFGIMAIAGVVLTVVSLLSDIGLRQAILQSPRGDQTTYLNTAWTMQVIRGVGIWVVCSVVAAGLYWARASGWVADESVYAEPVLPWVICATALTAVVSCLASTKGITANRSLDLKRVTLIELLSQAISLLVMAWLGWWTRSIWSFVIGGVVGAVVSTLMTHFWLPGQPNRFGWERRSAIELVSFGRWIFLSSAVGVLAGNADRLLLGGWTTPATLGLYAVALNLAMVAEGAGVKVFSGVSMPVLSEAARSAPGDLRRLYFKMRLPADLAFIGLAGFLFSAAPAVVRILFDARYAEAGEMLQILSFGLLFARYSLNHNAFLALGRPEYLGVLHAVKAVGIYVLILVLYGAFGLTGALVAVAIQMVPTLPLTFWYNRRHGLNDFRFEVVVLLAWPAGYLVAEAFDLLARWAF
jgi:O-antigen/teichoic acid export membrane protein